MAHAGLVARSAERRLIADVVAAADEGSPSLLLLHGEPGVGKTRLVTDAVASLPAASHQVLWAQCLRLRSDTGSFLPFSGALSRWLSDSAVDDRVRVFEGLGELAAIVPELGPESAQVRGVRLMALLSLVIHRISELAPLVVVVDDLQWADASSLETLAYVVVGLAPGARVTVLGTYRDTELGSGHRLHDWLADMRRMPRVESHRVERLDRAGTAALVREISDRSQPAPDPDQIFDRSLGNPYLTELLVADRELGADTLAQELLSSWRGLGAGARALTQVVAVGGRPIPIPVLSQVMTMRGREDSALLIDVAEAVEQGIGTLHEDEVWIRHPLLAEVIAQTVPPSVARAIHAAYVEVLEHSGHFQDVPELVRAELLTQHEEGAGRPTEAYVWALRAADLAREVQAAPEESEHLQRASRLWQRVDPAVRSAQGDGVELLERASVAAMLAGHAGASRDLALQAVAAVDVDAEPLRASRLLGTLPIALDNESPMGQSRQHAQRAIELAEPEGDSPELAIALANLAYWEKWIGAPSARDRVERALTVAERAAEPLALAWAHLVHSQLDDDLDRALAEAREAWSHLRDYDTVWGWSRKARLLANCLESAGRPVELIELGLAVQRDTTAAGYPIAGTNLSATTVWQTVRLGRYAEADELLHEVFSHHNFRHVAGQVRSAAARLAARRGDFHEAAEHAVRMHELLPGADPRGDTLDEADVEVCWATGSLAACADIVLADIPLQTPVDPPRADELLVWAARVAADLSETGADRGTARQNGRNLLNTAEALRGHTPPRFARAGSLDLLQPAVGAQFEAERARCLDTPDQTERWATAYDRCVAASLRWDAAWAAYQLARAHLRQTGHRPAGIAALRESRRLADSLAARPLLARIETVAVQTRVRLDDMEVTTSTEAPYRREVPIEGLTPREAEVLDHVLRGQTYAEIAQGLFISEKTVSVHISNLLRKTGTRSRVELAELAGRSRPS